MKNSQFKQFAFKVTGGESMVDEAIKMIFESGAKLDSMCAYGGGLMGGSIITYFVCFGDVEVFRKTAKTYIKEYQKKYELPNLIEKLSLGKIDNAKHDKIINEWRIFKYLDIIEKPEPFNKD